MNIVYKIKKGIVVTLASLIVVSSAPSIVEAARFKDVDKKHWAYKDIERVAELGYIKGTSSDEFSPEGILTFDQAISLLGRFTNPTKDEVKRANKEYGSYLAGLDIAEWAQEDMAVAMYKGVLSKAEMENIAKNKRIDKAITKVATSVYLVRAMGLAEEAESKNIVSLTYKDALEMSTTEMKYLAVLIEAGVLDPKGSGEGLFEPKSKLRRDVMAKMLATSYEYLDENPDKGEKPTKPKEDKDKDEKEDKEEKIETEKISGKILKPISEIGSITFVIVDDGKDGEQAYKIEEDTEISLDGKSITYLGLSQGQEVDLTIKKGTREIISIKAISVDEDLNGKIKYVSSSSNKLTLEYTVDKRTESNEYKVDKDAYIYLDGKSAKLKDLNEGDKVEVRIKNGVIYDIEAEAKKQKVEGIVKDLVKLKDSRDDEYYITIVDSKDNSYEFLIDEDTSIYRNNRRVSDPTDLKLKDEAYIEAEYGVAVEIDSNVVRKKIQGVIAGMNTRLHARPEITILNKDTKEEETYILGETPYIRVDRKVTNTFDLKVGYYVDLIIEGDEIIELDADSRGSEATIIGRVSYINTRNMEMEITIESIDLDSGKYGDVITVHLKDNVIVADEFFKEIDLSDIRRGDRVNVVGSYDGSSLIADTIQIR